ncbi:hypothetical protein HHI36_022366 [Cryptolaemus montrouzieri]|uniref:PHD-type domain-containing protein n=1 Tax=Cryptolaemus montrouzieri TaxID=559131 RepID=A0ABD2MZN6_9CUCU
MHVIRFELLHLYPIIFSVREDLKGHCLGNEPALTFGEPRNQYTMPKYLPPKTKKYVKGRAEAKEKYKEKLNFCKHIMEATTLTNEGTKGKIIQVQCSDCDSWFHKSCIQVDSDVQGLRAGKGNWTRLYCIPDLGSTDALRSSGPSAVTLEDIMSKLDETILPKLIRMEEKYNGLMEEFVLQANGKRTIKSELVLVKKELLEMKNGNEIQNFKYCSSWFEKIGVQFETAEEATEFVERNPFSFGEQKVSISARIVTTMEIARDIGFDITEEEVVGFRKGLYLDIKELEARRFKKKLVEKVGEKDEVNKVYIYSSSKV